MLFQEKVKIKLFNPIIQFFISDYQKPKFEYIPKKRKIKQINQPIKKKFKKYT